MPAAPPILTRANPANSGDSNRSGFRLATLILAGVALALAALVFFFNPATHNFYPVCQFHQLTGLNCPGCGMTRALYALLHGDFMTALHDNALLVLAIPLLSARALWWAMKKRTDRPAVNFFPAQWLWPLLFLALAFTILRNLPTCAFLSPA